MNSNEPGLTVGELTMALSALIIATLIWSTLLSKKDSEGKKLESSNLTLIEVAATNPYNQNSIAHNIKK